LRIGLRIAGLRIAGLRIGQPVQHAIDHGLRRTLGL